MVGDKLLDIQSTFAVGFTYGRLRQRLRSTNWIEFVGWVEQSKTQQPHKIFRQIYERIHR